MLYFVSLTQIKASLNNLITKVFSYRCDAKGKAFIEDSIKRHTYAFRKMFAHQDFLRNKDFEKTIRTKHGVSAYNYRNLRTEVEAAQAAHETRQSETVSRISFIQKLIAKAKTPQRKQKLSTRP